jgi:hypothetical protein
MNLPAFLSQMLGNAAQEFRTTDPTTDRFIHYLAQLQAQAFGRWAHVARSGVRCTVRFRPPGGPVLDCTSPGIGGCVACGQPCCLQHSMVSASGECVCMACIYKLVSGSKTASEPPPRVDPHPDDQDKLRRQYLRALKLKGNPSADEIRAAFKRRAADEHPDRFPPAKRRAQERKFKKLGQARDWLLKNLHQEAA